MKRLITLSLVTLLSFNLLAQSSDFVFFSQDGYKFWVILNGVRQNDQAETNVKVSGLHGDAAWKCKIIFEDAALGEIDKNIFSKIDYESTYAIKTRDPKKKTEVGKFMKKQADFVKKDLEIKSDSNKTQEVRYVLKLYSEVNIAQAPPPSPRQKVVVYHAAAPASTVHSTTVTQQSTTVTQSGTSTTAGTGTGENISMNVNVTESDGNVNMNVGTSTSGTHTSSHASSSTTTVTHSGYEQSGGDVIVEETGCMPMSESDFQSAKGSISSKSFEDSKLTLAKQVAQSNCLYSSQVKEIMDIFDFEDSKLTFAKHCYGYAYDQNNYYKVNDAFEFESSIEELNDYISSR